MTIIGGDFNHRPDTLEIWDEFRQKGYFDATTIAKTKWPEKVVGTCRGATNNDTLLIPACLVEQMIDFKVHTDDKFDIHAPLTVVFNIPVNGLYTRQWKQPATLESLCIEPSFFETAYSNIFDDVKRLDVMNLAKHDPDEAYKQWAGIFEECASQALMQQNSCQVGPNHQSGKPNKLTAKFRGRGVTPKTVAKPIPHYIRFPSNGGYMPAVDEHPVELRQVTRQVRRLHALHCRLSKWEHTWGSRFQETQIADMEQWNQAMQINSEWFAITRAKGFSPDFLTWISDPNRLGFKFQIMPTAVGIKHLKQFTQIRADQLAIQIQANRQKMLRMKIHYDMWRKGGKLTFKLIRPQGNPPIDTLTIDESFTLRAVRLLNKGLPRFRIDNGEKFDSKLPFVINGCEFHCNVISSDQSVIEFSAPSKPTCELLQVWHDICNTKTIKAKQTHWVTDPEIVRGEVEGYWDQFWNRDGPDSDSDFPPIHEAIHILNESLPVWDEITEKPTPSMWKRAVMSLKANAARGSDGFSSGDLKLLPLKAWSDIQELFDTFIDWPKVLGLCKTIFLTKVSGNPKPGDTRPITIASILYRLWASVHSKVFLKVWANKLPPSMSGGLPGRGTEEVLTQIQIALEGANTTVSGFVLDILKAFNAVCREIAAYALCRLGVPKQFVLQWMKALTGLRRSCCIQGNMGPPLPSNTGVPEGDCISILAMTAITFAWTCFTKTEGVEQFSYADNWEWLTHEHHLNRNVLLLTQKFSHALRLTISPTKSWCWASSKKGERDWRPIWNLAFPGQPINCQRHSNDLGQEVHYVSKHKMVNTLSRFEKAMAKANKIQNLPCDLSTKTQLVNRSVLPMALHGAEATHIGKQQLAKLRTAVSRCLIGGWKQASPWLVCGVCLCDPQMVLYQRILNRLQRLLIKTPSLGEKFWDIALARVEANGAPFGPAGVFAQMCKSLNWEILPQFQIRVHPSIVLDFCKNDRGDFHTALIQSWGRIVMVNIMHRVNLSDIPNFDLRQTHRILKEVPSHQQVLVLYHLSGAINTNIIRSKYDSQYDTQQCSFCQSRDTLEHRIFECPVTQTIRENNQALINDLMDTHKSFLHCPLFPVHDDWTLEHALCLSRGLDYEIEHTCDKVIAYTDGSTIPNNKATHLHSAYAVITIPTFIGEHKREVVEQYKADSTIPAFDVLVLSRVHGHQTNNRAELSSLVHAVASSTNVAAISDSSYAIQVVQDVIAEPDIKAHYKRANIDIIRQLIFYLKSMCHDSIVLRKVASHMQITSDTDVDLAFDYIANSVADLAAKQARINNIDYFVTLNDEIQRHDERWWDLLFRFYVYIVQMAQAYQQAWKQLKQVFSSEAPPSNIDFLQSWPKGECHNFTCPTISPEVREAMYYSSTYTIALVGWLQMLEWPVEIEHEDPGITFLELYISFCCATGSRVPFNTADKKLKVQTYQAFESDLLVKSMPYPLHQQLRVFEFSLAYIVKLFGDQAFPIGRKANVSSLIPIGFRTSRAGIRGRPKFPFRERIVSDLADFGFSNLAYKSIDGFSLPKLDPLIPTVLQDDDLVRNPHTSYTKFKRLLKRQWLFWESLRRFLFP